MIPSENTFAQLIGIEGNQWHYHIPRFQREYIWGKYNWNKLLEDVYENEPGHYMGSVICVHETNEYTPEQELIYEVVDGQQRLTTLSVLLSAIYYKLNNEAVQLNPSIKDEDDYIIKRNSIRQRLIKKVTPSSNPLPIWAFKNDGFVYCLRVQPSTQENNLEDYKYILCKAGILKNIEYPKNCGNRRLYKSFSYFLQNIPDDYDGLNDLLERIYRLSFIHISEASQSKAFLLFETLNFRGVPLSAIDIIKNKMLATLESKHNMSIDDAYDNWQKLLGYLPEEQDKNRFLRQYYNAFKYKAEVKVENISKATASTIITIYEKHIKTNAQKLFNDLLVKAEIYNKLIEPEKYQESRLNKLLIDLDRIGAAASYSSLMYLFSLDKDAFGENDWAEKLIDFYCKYYFRRNITDFPNTRDLDAINIDLIEYCEQIRGENRKLKAELIIDRLRTGKGKPSNLDALKENLADNLFYNNEGMTRFALAKIDETSHSREYAPNLWQRNEKGLYVWTIEHIFPQGKNIPEYWVEMIGGGDKEEAQKVQGEMVHCLGNLTLSGYNSRLSNLSFEKKQSKSESNVFGNKIYVGYKNGLALNNIRFMVNGNATSLAQATKWTKGHIQSRNDVLVDMLVKLYKFEDEMVI